MVLLHRVTPFALLAVVIAGFGLAMAWNTNPLLPLGISLGVCALLFLRLIGWSPRTESFWNLLLAPLFFLASVQGLFLLAETVPGRLALAALAAFIVYFFAEQVFAYVHAPAIYRPFAIQHLSLGMNVLTIFCASAFAFGSRIFLHTSFYALVPMVTLLSGLVMYQTLWVSKMEGKDAAVHGMAGGLMAGEVFLALALLPTGFYVNAALLATLAYVYLGMARAKFLDQLTRNLAYRYVAAGAILSAVIFGTAAWH